MLMSLKTIYEMLESINQKSYDKEGLLKTHLNDPIFGKTLRRVLEYITNDKYVFSLKRINYCVYFDDPIAAENQNSDGIFEMLDYLNNITSDVSDEERAFLEKVSSIDPETVEVVTRILNKYSGCGLIDDDIIKILEEDTCGYKEDK
jgi:hypothetical protein